MYLEHFKLKKLPFGLTPDTQFFCDLPSYQTALNVLLFSIKSGEGFIKIIAEVGSGKTLLCRLLLNKLDESFVTAYIPNPDLNPMSLRKALAQELNVETPPHFDQSKVNNLLLDRLTELHSAGKRVVLIIDEAQALPDESLEALRLLTNLETESEKLLQIVLFAQPELDVRLKQHNFRQLRQRITFSNYLQPLTREGLDAYLCHRLNVAGHTKGTLFTKKAHDLLFQYSRGTPRVVNILCHKALLVAYGLGMSQVDHVSMMRAIKDSHHLVVQPAKSHSKLHNWLYGGLGLGVLAAAGVAALYYFGLLRAI